MVGVAKLMRERRYFTSKLSRKVWGCSRRQRKNNLINTSVQQEFLDYHVSPEPQFSHNLYHLDMKSNETEEYI